MHSNTQSADSADTSVHRLAEIVGTAIGLLTLTLPLFVIAHYSPSSVQNSRQPMIYHVRTYAD
jgi:hypothetical protein